MISGLRKKSEKHHPSQWTQIAYRVTLTKQVEGLCDKNIKSFKKEIEEDTRKWKYLPCSWVDRINIIKMAILPKAIYRFNAMPFKISAKFPHRPWKNNTKLLWKGKKPRIAQTILYNKRTFGGIKFLPSNSTTVLWYWKQPGIGTKTVRRTNGAGY